MLIDEVQPYIAASLAADEERRRQAEATAEAERRRELDAAQRLASEQHKRAHVAIGLSLVAVLLAVIAGWQWSVAQDQTHLVRAYANTLMRDLAALKSDTAAARVEAAKATQEAHSADVPRSATEELLTQAEQLQEGASEVKRQLAALTSDTAAACEKQP